ncbi:MAG TPA: hypothetical protein VK470_02805 [Bacteroidota bacterium]|nr:hypothetical protein [Bacteroidota bacterium]
MMRAIDIRIPVIAVLVIVASTLGYYRHTHRADRAGDQDAGQTASSFFPGAQTTEASATPERVRPIVDTTLQILGAKKKFLGHRLVADSGRTIPETMAGVPSSFDDLHLIRALTDSLRASGLSVSGIKSLKEKTTTIRIRDREHICMYRCLLYRKELSH